MFKDLYFLLVRLSFSGALWALPLLSRELCDAPTMPQNRSHFSPKLIKMNPCVAFLEAGIAQFGCYTE